MNPRPTAAEPGALVKFQMTKVQLLLAALALIALTVLGVLTLAESRSAARESKILSNIETPAASIIFTQRETLVYATRLALWSNGGTTRREVQISRNLLAQRLAVIDSSGRTMGERANSKYWSALKRADALVASAPMGILPESLHTAMTRELLPVIDEILAQARDLVVSYQRSVDNQMLERALESARRDSVKLFLFYLFIITAAITLALVLRTNFKNFQRVRKAIRDEQTRLDETLRELDVALLRVEQLQNLDEAKSALISNVNHELRTPLTSILGYIELIQRDSSIAKNPKLDRYLLTLERNSQILLSLVESFLTLSKFDSSAGVLPSDQVSITEVIDSAIFTVTPVATKAEISIELTSVIDRYVLGDFGQLSQVFINLLTNAIKFSPPGSEINVDISATDCVMVTIRDHGIGIPAPDLSNLFTRFFRASNVPTSKYQGTGLGLSIARQIIELHGGAISVESKLGEGSTFVVEIPLAKGDSNE